MNKFLYIVVICLIYSLVVISPVIAQDTVIVPDNREDVQANGAFTRPFNCVGLPPNGVRWQQIYAASQIGQAGMIDKVNFRLNALTNGTNAFFAVYPNVQIQLSTTDKVPVDATGDPMSNVFAENIGADVKTVYSGNLVLSAPECIRTIATIQEPCPFDVMITLQEMFEYDPANGSLLFDIRLPQCPDLTNSVAFDLATFNLNDNAEKVSIAWQPDVNATEDIAAVGNGLVTEFRFFIPRSVPTLSEWGLIATAGILGLAGFIVIRRRQTA